MISLLPPPSAERCPNAVARYYFIDCHGARYRDVVIGCAWHALEQHHPYHSYCRDRGRRARAQRNSAAEAETRKAASSSIIIKNYDAFHQWTGGNE